MALYYPAQLYKWSNEQTRACSIDRIQEYELVGKNSRNYLCLLVVLQYLEICVKQNINILI